MQGKRNSSSIQWVRVLVLALTAPVLSAKYSLSVLGNQALALGGTDAASAVQNVAASAAFSAVKEQVSHFAENSKVLVRALDEIGKAHPFILSISPSPSCSRLSSADLCCVVAVSVFKAAITLELTREENDQKVTVLNATMCDMMQVLTLLVKYLLLWWCAYTPCSLKDVASPKDQAKDGVTIEQRLQGRMGGIVDSVKKCAKLCDSYQKRHIAGEWCYYSSSLWC